MKILLINDDGIQIELYRETLSLLNELNYEVFSFLPKTNQSACSASISLNTNISMTSNRCSTYEICGTPTDCLHIGINYLKKLNKCPDLIISGINDGLNYGTTIAYSGTVKAAMEANLYKINSIAFSLVEKRRNIELKSELKNMVEHIINFYNERQYVGFTLNVNLFNEEKLQNLSDEKEIMDRNFILPNVNVIDDCSIHISCNKSSFSYPVDISIGGICRQNGYALDDKQRKNFFKPHAIKPAPAALYK